MSATIDKPALALPASSLTSRLAGPLIVAAVLTMLIVPLSPMAISLMFALNISSGFVIIIAAIYVSQASELLSFPSILLGTTLMRLALNVATARAILLNGYTGADAAGTVIESFGRFVVGGNYVVGFIIFGILIVINFVVVTKGSSRVAEVAARFTLDSLPGRQMAIDADVNAGASTPKQAEKRREQLRAEADFFGAMDGASKFVRGDVVAAMIILAVNLVGGLLIGVFQHGLPLDVAARTYALLTVGDGVAAQIPSLTISVAAGLIVTRVSTGEDLSAQVVGQIANYPQALLVAGGLVAAMGLIPGMAHVPFLALGGILIATGERGRRRRRAAAALPQPASPEKEEQPQKVDITSVQRVDRLSLEIGFALVPMVGPQPDKRPTLPSRLTSVRTRFSDHFGFIIPHIRISDSEKLRPQGYQFAIRSGVIGRGEVFPDLFLAIETDLVLDKLEGGRPARDPVFGSPALWIDPALAAKAEAEGYTVADAASVIATHFDACLKRHAWELLGRPEVEEIMAVHARLQPKLIDDLRSRYQMGAIRQVLSDLLSEGVQIRDFERIAEAMTDASEAAAKEPDKSLAAVRRRLSRQIIAPLLAQGLTLRVLALDPEFEKVVMQSIDATSTVDAERIVEPKVLSMLRNAVAEGKALARRENCAAVLAVPDRYRRAIARAAMGSITVLGIDEIPDDQNVKVIGLIKPPSGPPA